MRTQLPEMRARLQRLDDSVEALTARWQTHDRLDAQNEAQALRELISDVETGAMKERYNARVQPFIDALRRTAAEPPPPPPSVPSPAPPPQRTTQQRARRKHPRAARDIRLGADSGASIRDEFVAASGPGDSSAASAVFVTSGHACTVCVGGVLRRHTTESLMVCDTCGDAQPLLESTTSTLGYSDDANGCEFTSFSYKRENHFAEWLACTQAKESAEIPESVLQEVMGILYEQRIERDDITPENVRQALKQLRLRKHYEHTQLVHSLLTGKPAPRFTADQESRLRQMFLLIQQPFEDNCPQERKNFLSYSYCLYKFCELLGLDHFLDSFALLKGETKLRKQDAIWKKICEDPRVGWQFISSVS